MDQTMIDGSMKKEYRRPDKKVNVSMTHNCKRKHQCTTMHDTKTADMRCIPTRKKDNEYKSCLKRKKPAEAE
jgi:hypothetical protein